MIIKKYLQHNPSVILPIALMLASSNAFSANFSIAPTYPLPHSMSLGQQVAAYYTITNKTTSARIGYKLVGLPVGVTQIINANPGSCQALISLNSNQSCSLQLLISSPVNSNFALCNGDSCTSASEPLSLSIGYAMVAAGGYSTQPGNSFPLLAASLDNGNNWSYRIDSANAPADINGSFNRFNSANCSGSTCVAAGSYSTQPGNYFPLLATSSDNGLSWSYKIDDSNAPVGNTFGSFYSANCSGSTCVAAGRYLDSSGTRYPLLATSHNSGASWTYSIDSSTPNLPNDYVSDGSFSSANSSSPSLLPSSLKNLLDNDSSFSDKPPIRDNHLMRK